MKTCALLLTSLLFVTPIAISAEETAPAKNQAAENTETKPLAETHEEIFTKLDIDQDNKISMKEAEVSPALSKGFASIDTDKDGFLTKEEFANLWARAAKTRDRLAMVNNASL
ncbi:hypothetical protein ACFVYJ_03760 [Pontibacter sp. JAM-7]|uniref:hypothetical protein n=1 Tax=Pontibacter sp. JAM-7 TaxID=3366581 RepID=UPI003AF4BC32